MSKERSYTNLAIIPARGGSKRIPHKNIIPFHGKPLISYSIMLARNSGLFDEVMVSTDDPEIAEISKNYGAVVPFFRSPKNSDAFATLSDVMDEVINEYKSQAKLYNHVCCILPTAVLLSNEILGRGYEQLLSGRYNSVRPVVRYSYPVQRAFKLENGFVEFIHEEYTRTRSQDLEPAFHDAGQCYWFYFEKGMVAERKGAFEISELEAQDIDTFDDLKIAELKYSLRKQGPDGKKG
ncbi:MAG: pseudaminic acid cytidylyltransferase [Bacteroidales bacterium]